MVTFFSQRCPSRQRTVPVAAGAGDRGGDMRGRGGPALKSGAGRSRGRFSLRDYGVFVFGLALEWRADRRRW